MLKKRVVFGAVFIAAFTAASFGGFGVLGAFGIIGEAAALSEDQESEITQSCPTIKESLKKLQRSDSKTRSYLGATYQTLISDYIKPLNMNLVKSGHPSGTITELYSDILEERKKFGEKFTDYSLAFEELLLVDCKADAEGFYNKLGEVRKKRKALESSTKNLRSLLGNQYTAVKELRKEYDGED